MSLTPPNPDLPSLFVRSFDVPSGRARLAGRASGAARDDGAAVVFLHAGVCDQRGWDEQVRAVTGTLPAVTYDRRGFGLTAHADETYSHTADLAAVLDHAGVRQAVLVGGSQGGRVALDFTLAHPQRVRALVLVAPAVSGAPGTTSFPPDVQSLLERLEAAEEAGDTERVNTLEAQLWLDGALSPAGRVGGAPRELFLSMNGAALAAPPLGHETQSAPAWPRLEELRVPTLVLWGDLDLPGFQSRCEQIVARVPGARGYVMRGAAHLPHLEQPQAFNALLTEFLTDVMNG